MLGKVTVNMLADLILTLIGVQAHFVLRVQAQSETHSHYNR
jgi:hypothetical protein